jgi:hypothetical protein
MSQATVSYISDDGEEFRPCTPPEGNPPCTPNGAAAAHPPARSFPAALLAALLLAQ